MHIIKLIVATLSLAGTVGCSDSQGSRPKGCHVSEDKMGRGETRQCIVPSSNGLSSLVIENKYGSVNVYINFNTILNFNSTLPNNGTLLIRWDDEKAVRTVMKRSSDFESMFFVNASSAISKIVKSKILMVESATLRRGESIDTFSISNGEALANFVLK